MDATYLCHGPAAQMDQMGREGYALRLGSTKIGPFKTTLHTTFVGECVLIPESQHGTK